MTTPDPLTRDQAAAVLGVTPRSLTRYAGREDDPLRPIQTGGHGKATLYDPASVGQWLLRYQLAKLQDRAGHQDPIDFHHERARLTKAQAEYQELRNAELRRELARVELLGYAIARAGSQVAAVLGTVKGRVKRAQPNLSNDALHEIEQIVVEAQNAAADIQLDWSDAPDQ